MKKDREWVFIELGKLFPSHAEIRDYPDNVTVTKRELLNKVYDILSQLDEPEVLSQELPVIPEYVANWIIRHRDAYNLYQALRKLENNTLFWGPIYEWYRIYTHKFVNAYLTGEYEVEEEQKYYVEDRKHALLCKWESSDGWEVISTMEATEDGLHTDTLVFELTEQEIKDYDPRYWAFAEPVEEDE